MSALLPLLATAPAVTGIAGYVVRDFWEASAPAEPTIAPPEPPPAIAPVRPQIEYFNLAELTTTDPRGFVRQVDRFRVEPWGLYMSRTIHGPRIQYLESWLLPELALRATIAHFQPGHHRNLDYRLDVGEFTRTAPKRWKAIDHYLNITVRHGRTSQLHGVPQLFAAHAAGLVATAAAHRAVERATTAMEGLAQHGHEVEPWLAARGVTLSWM